MRVQLHRARQHRIVAVPLDEVGAAHEGAVLRGPAVVVPQIEIDEIDRLRERRSRQQAVLAQRSTMSDAVCTRSLVVATTFSASA